MGESFIPICRRGIHLATLSFIKFQKLKLRTISYNLKHNFDEWSFVSKYPTEIRLSNIRRNISTQAYHKISCVSSRYFLMTKSYNDTNRRKTYWIFFHISKHFNTIEEGIYAVPGKLAIPKTCPLKSITIPPMLG